MSFPITVYLDSSDFSTLSSPAPADAPFREIARQLEVWVDTGQIRCCFSGTHLSEMAPQTAKFADAAVRRADMLVRLCGRNAVISQDVLFTQELGYAIGANTRPTVHSPDGDWCPGGIEEVSPVTRICLDASLREGIDELTLNREMRRKAERRAFKAGAMRSGVAKAIRKNARSAALDEILALYPMREQDARVITLFVAGAVSEARATAAFAESLRDPRWMMRWFAAHHDKLTPFIAWTRTPAASINATVVALHAHATALRKVDAALGTNSAHFLASRSAWERGQDGVLVSIATRMADVLRGTPGVVLPVKLINSHCAGMSVGVRSLHSSWWASLAAKSPRAPMLSDFPDALHAMYAPYVDVFRADSFMAPSIQRHSAAFGTEVVQKLVALPGVIEHMLRTRGASGSP